MQDDIHYIDDYFLGNLSKEEISQFEKRILEDPGFAETVTFYLSAKQTAKDHLSEEKKTRYKEIYNATNGHHPAIKKQGRLRTMVLTAAVAASIAAVVTLSILHSSSTDDLANQYIERNLSSISVTMGVEDEMQKGIRLYNEGKFSEALAQFESIISKDSSAYPAFEYAGLACLRLSDYDKSLYYFKLLEHYPGLFSNRGVFLQAVTLLKRNQKDDKDEVRRLLKRVVTENLEGKETAEKWLKEF